MEVDADDISDVIEMAENMYDDDYNFSVEFHNEDYTTESDAYTHIMRDDYEVEEIK
jgi:hypothetical protein